MINKAIDYLSKDKTMKQLIAVHEKPVLKNRKDYFAVLAHSIIYQQLAGKAAETIYKRFKKLCGRVTAQRVSELNTAQLRSVGLSQNKECYIKDLAGKFIDSTIQARKFKNMNDAEIIEALTRVKGIGEWTAQMFLMFSLNRMDVFAPEDYGLRKAIQKIHNLDKLPTPKEAEEIADKWKPYRTVASLYLWESL